MLIALLIFLAPLAYSPGPGNMVFAANGARFGVVATLPASIGYHLATFVVTLMVGLGFGGVLVAAPQLGHVIRVGGSLYVLYLAWKMTRSGTITDAKQAKPIGFWDGVMLLLLNAKGYVIMTLMFTQFLTGPELGLILWITGIFTLNNFLAFTVWTLTGDMLARRFRDPAKAQRLSLLFGGMLAVVAIWMLLR